VLDSFRFLRLFRLENEEIIIPIKHESSSIKKNPLPYMAYLKAKVTDFDKADLKSIKLKYITKNGKELTIYLLTQNKRDGRGAFFIPNPGGTKSSEITDIRTYFVDIDFAKASELCESEEKAKQLEQELKETGKYDYVEAVEKDGHWYVDSRLNKEEIDLKKNRFKHQYYQLFKENLICETYAGFHIYFLLSVPEKTDDFSIIQKALAKKFEGDPSISNPSRIMRLPDFFHMKYDDPYQIKVINWPTKRWTKEEIINTYKLQLIEPQKTGIVTVQEVDVNPYTGKKTFYTRKKMLDKPKIMFKKPAVAPLKRKEISLNMFIDEVRKRPFSDFIKSPEMEVGPAISCPFHHDNHPSAGVFITKDGEYGFNCFGCEAGFMNIIGIHRQTTGFGYIKSLHELAAILGYEITETKFEQAQFKKYRLNSRFLILDDIETFYPNIWYWIKPSKKSSLRFDVLKFLNSYGEATLVKDDFQYDGEHTTFLSFHHLERSIKKDYGSVYRTIKLLALLGFIDIINNSVIHPDLKKMSEKQREIGMWREKEEREKLGKAFDESKYREISYYSIPLWQDRIDEIEKMAKKLRDIKFTIRDHLNKKGIELLFGKELANKLYSDERTLPKKTSNLFDSFNRIVVKEVQNKGHFPVDNIVDYEIKITEKKGKRKALTHKEKLEHLKELLPAIKEENGFTSIFITKAEKKEFYGVKSKSNGRTTIILSN
jgi:hypothetical protein